MPLSAFLRTYRRRWFVPAALLAVALAGVFFYEHTFGLKEAVATVAVLDPLTTRPGAYTQAQVTFDSVIESQALAERVGQRLGRSPDSVHSHLSVSISASLQAYNASPVYAVYATDKTYAGALALANAAVEEGRLLYIEDNTPDPDAVKQAVAAQLQQAQNDLQTAVTAYAAFMKNNDAIDLEPRIGKLRDAVYALQLAAIEAQADAKAQYAANNWTAGAYAADRAVSLQASMAAEQTQLNSLLALEIPYGVLSANLQTAQTRVNQIQDYELGTLTGEQLPLSGEIKILDPARPNSHQLVTLLTYGIGAVLGLLAGATAIYLLGLVYREPETAEEIGRAFGAPVLARLPVEAAA
jgi:hypothetical protein